MNFILTEFKSITRVLAMVVQVKRRIHVTDEESERSEDDCKGFSVQVPMYWYRMHASHGTATGSLHEERNWKMKVRLSPQWKNTRVTKACTTFTYTE